MAPITSTRVAIHEWLRRLRQLNWRGIAWRIPRMIIIGLILLIALIGFLFITRGTAVQHVVGVGADAAPVSPAEPEFPLSVAVLTGAPLTSGNRVQVALDGDGTFPQLWDDLRSAREYITIQMYYGKPGSVADSLRRILLERAAAGVRVMFLYDAFGTQDMPDESVEAFRAAGIRVEAFRPLRVSTLWVIQNRSHVRGIVIDGRIGWTGGFGIDDKWLGDGRTNGAWRETNVRFEGPAVRQLQAAFAASWTEATGALLSGRGTVVRYEESAALAGLLFATPTLGSTAAERYVAMSIAGAQRTLYITNAYFAPNDDFVAMLERAARRGVDTRLLVAGRRTDVNTARLAGRRSYERLLEAGVRIFEWQPSTLHAKTFVADGIWTSISTMNFDNRSLVLNEEVALMVLDTIFGRQMDSVFIDDLRYAAEIDLEQFRQRSWFQRLLEKGAGLLTRVL